MMEWFNLALISAVTLALADTFSKKYFSSNSGWELLLVRFSAPGALLLPLALTGHYPAITSDFWLWIAALIPMELVAMLFYSLAIRDSALYLTLPYLAFTPVFSVATGYFILGESVSPDKFLGIILVVVGAYLLNIKKHIIRRPRDLLLPLTAIVSERGSRLMLAAAVIYSFTSVMGKGAMQYIEPRQFGAFYFSMVGAGALLVTLAVKPKSIAVVRAKPLSVLIVAVFMAAMVVSHFLAIAQVEVAYMITVKRTSLLFGIAFGAVFFAEKGIARHLIAGSMMVAGVAVILI